MLISAIIGILLSAVLFAATFIILRKKSGGSVAAEIQQKSEKIKSIIASTKERLASGEKLASRAQLEAIIAQIDEVKTSLANEKGLLVEIEQKLTNVQKQVENKEHQHQEMKTSKEEDEKKLAEIMAKYENISQESIELEQQLASSMKSLDAIMVDLPMTDSQKAIIEELSATLTSSGERMRDLLTEYNLVKERLDTLSMQHKDLEEEYTRLVEQQLGE